MLHLLKKLFYPEIKSEEFISIQAVIQQVQKRESRQDIPLGRRIHSFDYSAFQLSLDRDITENYRVTVYQGRDRIYSFTIFANQKNYNILEEGYSRIIAFLDGERNVAELPDNDIIKGFFYGH